jgi:ATP-dependent phosphofructokinase / diphosphate-dependent phosphofructokinase
MSSLLIAQAGGPSCALNATLKGVIEEAKKHSKIDKIYGALGGAGGILDKNLVDLGNQSQRFYELLSSTPASVIGTSRRPLFEDDFQSIIKTLKELNVEYFFYNGGNGSMATCNKLFQALKEDIKIIGIPKTIDNDIAVIDHCPGFGSAARYMAVTTSEIAQDIAAMPIHVCIVEAMGRNAGWITAASALANKSGKGPHLIYVPERPFIKEQFLSEVEKMFKEMGGVLVVVSEGITDEKGRPIVPPMIVPGSKDPYVGDVAVYLAQEVFTKLGIKARSEKPGIALRASVTHQSVVDIEEARRLGALAVKSAVEGKTGYMVGIKRVSSCPYLTEDILVPLSQVATIEQKLPDRYINEKGNGITKEFLDYCSPLVGELPEFAGDYLVI